MLLCSNGASVGKEASCNRPFIGMGNPLIVLGDSFGRKAAIVTDFYVHSSNAPIQSYYKKRSEQCGERDASRIPGMVKDRNGLGEPA